MKKQAALLAVSVICALGLLSLQPSRAAQAAVVVTVGTASAPLSSNGAVGTGLFTPVSTIVISEGAPGDFPIASAVTASIGAPAGWEFLPGALDTSASTYSGMTSLQAVATASRIDLTYTAVPLPGIDVVRIAGLMARPMSNATGEGAASGMGVNGTASISGFTNTVFITLTSTVGGGGFAAPPVYSPDNLAQVVFKGGAVTQLAQDLLAVGASGAWAQDARGAFALYIVNAGFVNDPFNRAFPGGFTAVTPLTIVRDAPRTPLR